jgi:hypothetical protein
MTIKKVARHAETLFATLCAEYGATCNPAVEDERGWDHFVQFPRRRTPELPLDMTPAAVGCLAQIKSSSSRFPGVRLKVSNALELATSDMPCFVILFRYSGSCRIQSLYVLHFWHREISRTLKRIRELDSEGRRDLHRFTLHFSMNQMHRIKASELLSYLESTIQRQGERYADKKREIAANVGFENVAVEGHIAFREGVTLDDIIDVQIGLKDSINAANFEARSVRFGIPARTPFASGVPAHVSIRSNPKKCIVHVSSERCGREISLPSDLYAPSIPGVPKEKLRLRITNTFMQLVHHAADDNLSFISRWNNAAEKDLDELATILDLIHIFGSGRTRIRLSMDGRPLASGSGETTRFEITPTIEAIDAFVRFLRTRPARHEVPQDFRLSIRDLFTRAYEIAQHNELVMKPSIDGSGVFGWDAEPYTGPAKLLYSVPVELPRHVVYTIVRRKLDLQLENENTTSLLLREIDYTRVRILPGSLASTQSIIAEEVKSTGQEISEGAVIIMHQPLQSLRAPEPDSVDLA